MMRVDADRLWSDLMTLGAIGALPRGGCDRLALTDAVGADVLLQAILQRSNR